MTDDSLSRVDGLLQFGRTDDAAAMLGRIIAREPDNAEAHATLALTLLDGNPDDAWHHATRAVSIAPDSARSHRVAAYVCSNTNRHSDAVAHAQAYVRIRPNMSDAHQTLAQMICSSGKKANLESARLAANEAIRLDPNRAVNWYALGRVHLMEEKVPDAELAFNQALRLDPQMAEAKIVLSRLQTGRRNFASAVTLLNSLVKADPSDQRSVREIDRTIMVLLGDLLWVALVIGGLLAFAVSALIGSS